MRGCATFASPVLPTWRRRAAQSRICCSAGKDDRYEGRTAALSRWNTAEAAYPSGADAFRAELGRGAASAIRTVYPTETRVLVLCGPGRNGAVGRHLAVALSGAGYQTAAYFCSDNVPSEFLGTCVDHVSFVPSTTEYYFDLAIDAVLGIGYDGGDLRGFTNVPFEFVANTRLPVVSVDVPSGWDVDYGPREIDLRTDDFVKPRLLVSLGKPKECAKKFAGPLHYVYDWTSGSEQAELFASNARAFKGDNGEVYGRSGMFEATLFSKREAKRTWVYTEDDSEELWDELD